MKSIYITLIILLGSFSLGLSQNIRFQYTVTNNGASTDVDIFMYNSAASGTENVAGFTIPIYHDSTESLYPENPGNNPPPPNLDYSYLPWFVTIPSDTFIVRSNTNIPISHNGYGEYSFIDALGSGMNIGQTPVQVLRVTYDNTVGNPTTASDFYFAGTTEHISALVYTSASSNSFPVIVDPLGNFPVELLEFNAKAVDGGQSLLTWTTASELNNKGFKIQRINDDPNSANWEELGFVDGMGTTDELTDYAFIDPNPRPGENLYRLQQVDFNGDFEYSEVRTVWFDQGVGVNVYPNPTSSYVNVKFEELNYDKDTANYTVQDQRGRLVFEGTVDALRISQIDFSKLPEGTYYLKLEYDGRAAVKEIVKIN